MSTEQEVQDMVSACTFMNKLFCSFYGPPSNDIDPLICLRESLESLHSQESGSPVVLLGGDFNLPDISWNEGYGSVNANPAYGLETNNNLLDIVNDWTKSMSWK